MGVTNLVGQTPGESGDREVWHAAIRGISKSWTWFRDQIITANLVRK